ncbi:GNAT family N-acetyltransferase [Pseudonocardia kunmingensis]|uniref:Acetyltransferase (GNAT) family protein n=1 Tax=Pseudonocardia kunmingensis TaxID=630975 RepID=A0A543E1U2_9PSEU|nr:GNAT family N-acetyltransferase [Pseudonocardia kunmingensis]TQM15542.1 acetyltransferase (GNAT) family protein [Pseudonocardia kunmingensis]
MEIRNFEEADRPALRALFGRAGEGAPTASLWGHVESEAAVYLTPYMDLEPESLFVAVVDGELAGYLTGSLGTAVPGENARMERAIREHRLVLRRGPAAFFARSVVDVAGAALRRQPTAGELHDPRWPAHLHINLLPRARGTGAAAGLMEHWFARLRETGTPGCYLQTLVENRRATRFFERMGFHAHGPTPAVPGLRYEGGRVHQLTMVRPGPV